MHDKKAIAAGVRKWWIKNIIFLVLVGAILFIASGNFNWGMAWAYLIAMVLIVIANAIAMDPALLAERSQLQEGTKKWDVAIAILCQCLWNKTKQEILSAIPSIIEEDRNANEHH